jgi:hypothetical protein
MAPRLLNMYKLRKGAPFEDLFPMDFLDVLWQAFDKDKLESITLELSRNDERIRMRVMETKKKPREP